MTGTNIVRILMGAIGLGLLAGGIIVGLMGGAAIVPAFWMISSGVVLVVVAVIETTRYRSEMADVFIDLAIDVGLRDAESLAETGA